MHFVRVPGGAPVWRASASPSEASKVPKKRIAQRGMHRGLLSRPPPPPLFSRPVVAVSASASSNQSHRGDRETSPSSSPESTEGRKHQRGGRGGLVEEDGRGARSPSGAAATEDEEQDSETISSPLVRPRPPRFPVPRSSVTLSPTVRTVRGPPDSDGPTGQRMAATRARALQQQREQRRKGGRGGLAAAATTTAAKNNAVPFPFPPTTTAAALQSSFRSVEDNDFYYSPSSILSPSAVWEEDDDDEEEGQQQQQRRRQRPRRRQRRHQSPSAAAPSPPPPTSPPRPSPPRAPPLAPLAAALRVLLASLAVRPDAAPLKLARSLWLRLPYRVRRLSWPLFGPPPLPAFHASPRAAALRASVASGGDAGGERALRVLLQSRAVGRDGRAADAGSDVPRYLLEGLVGRGLRSKAAARVREALTLPSALPRRAGPSSSGAAAARGSSSSGSSGGSSGSSGDDDDNEDQERPPSASALASVAAPSPPAPIPQFERLEYLGDAVLELAAREWSLRRFPRATEHGLSNSARSLVCGRSLLAAAAAARLDVFVTSNARTMSRSEYLTHWAGAGGLASLVDAVEAVGGALYLEFGLKCASEWVLRLALGVSVAADDEDEGVRGARRGGVEELERGQEDSSSSSSSGAFAAFDDDDFDFDGDEEGELASSSALPLPSSLSKNGTAAAVGGTRLLLDNNYKSLLAIVAGHASVEYRGAHVLCESGWGGHSPGHPATKGSAALPAAASVSEGDGSTSLSAGFEEGGGRALQQQQQRSRAAWLWVSRVSVDGRLRGVGADVHRPTAEQAAARQALAGAGVDADALWRERLADQM